MNASPNHHGVCFDPALGNSTCYSVGRLCLVKRLNLRDLPSHFGSHVRLKTGTLGRWVCNGASCRVGEYVQRLMKHTQADAV